MSNKLIDFNALSSYKTQSDLIYQDKLTAGNSITISNNVISAVPTCVTNVTSGSQNISNNTIVSLGNVTLMPGKYIVSYTCIFNSNSTGNRQCGFSTNTTDITGFGRAWGDFRRAASGVDTTTNVSGIVEVKESEYPNGRTFYFLAKQNSGGTLGAAPRCNYFKF